MSDQTHKSRDYFAELYIAGILGDAGWSIYFPKRDVGFDFIATKEIRGSVVMRPVQVKGRYPTDGKGDKSVYGYIGRLTQLHSEMVLAIPFFPVDQQGKAPACIAYMPRWRIRPQSSKGYACQPAQFKDGVPTPRRDFKQYFDLSGIEFMESDDWSRQRDGV